MLKGLYTAYTGMINEQHRMDTMTNNLANADTNGYKKEGATSQAFDGVLAYKIKDLSEAGNLPKRIGTMNLGVKIGENYVDYSEGGIKETGNPFDLALTDRGFFAIEYTNKAGETSVKYTRDGNFTMDQEGYLVTQDGDRVLDNRGTLIKSDGDFSLDEEGYLVDGSGTRALTRNGLEVRLNPREKFSVHINGDVIQNNKVVARLDTSEFEDHNYGNPIRLRTNATETMINADGEIYQDGVLVATIQVADFEDYNYLERYGENLFDIGIGANQIAPENTKIYQGYLELSNISVVTEMVNMISIQRQYESNQKVITTYDETLETATSQLGRL